MKYSVTLPILLLLAGCSTPELPEPSIISYELPEELAKKPETMSTIPVPTTVKPQ